MGVIARQRERGKGKPWYIFIILLIIFQSAIIDSYAGTIKEEYELQEKCGKSAADAFKKYYGNEGLLTHYNNHYNKKLNKCFILITETTLPKNKGDHPCLSILLYDVNENKEYGSFFMFTDSKEIMDCTILGNHISSKAEWDNLIKQYMEE